MGIPCASTILQQPLSLSSTSCLKSCQYLPTYTEIRTWANCLVLFFLLLSQWTPLHIAAERGHDYTVEYLVEKQADVNIRDEDGVRVTIPLMVADLSQPI